ncbi:MAG: hypothetical protein ACRCYO_19965, partial [Bacteroidia bacterium]
MNRLTCFFVFLSFLYSASAIAQENVFRTGILHTHLTIAPGMRSIQKSPVIYLQGSLGYFFSERFSLRGSGWYQAVKGKDANGLAYSHSFLSGGSWHLLSGRALDPYFGCMTGLAFSRRTSTSDPFAINPMHADPILAPHVGVRMFGEKIFHLFAEAEYVFGQFRIRLTDRINTEWFADYISTNLNNLASRSDYHIGWSV